MGQHGNQTIIVSLISHGFQWNFCLTPDNKNVSSLILIGTQHKKITWTLSTSVFPSIERVIYFWLVCFFFFFQQCWKTWINKVWQLSAHSTTAAVSNLLREWDLDLFFFLVKSKGYIIWLFLILAYFSLFVEIIKFFLGDNGKHWRKYLKDYLSSGTSALYRINILVTVSIRLFR